MAEHEKHNLFKPKNLEDGKHNVVGDCNGVSTEDRWRLETPLFAAEILKNAPPDAIILDYGCGVGRLAKEILLQRSDVKVVGVDASQQMLDEALKYVNDPRFSISLPLNLRFMNLSFDVVYCIYVLQHCPAIELRDVLMRIFTSLKSNGRFIYCSSDYRMAVRYDGKGFFDDRFLGVDIRDEVSRLFDLVSDLFDRDTIRRTEILKTMITGPLPHPAEIYTKRKIPEGIGLYDVSPSRSKTRSTVTLGVSDFSNISKYLLVNRLAPGDILVMTNAVRDFANAFPHYSVSIRTPMDEIFDNNPYVKRFEYNEEDFHTINEWFQTNDEKKTDGMHRAALMGDIAVIDMQYPEINKSGTSGKHFGEGHRRFLEDLLNVRIRQDEIRPEIYLSSTEKKWTGPVILKGGYSGRYWAINAGSKNDYTLKQYHRYQEVVDLLKDEITFVQIGQIGHNHNPLVGAIDMRGKTNTRELFRLIDKADGVLTCVSFPMHIAGAFSKPCVVVAGGREPVRWEMYGNVQYIHTNGQLDCCAYDGCWKSKHSDCLKMLDAGHPKCMDMITPEMIADRIRAYYVGGILKPIEHSVSK